MKSSARNSRSTILCFAALALLPALISLPIRAQTLVEPTPLEKQAVEAAKSIPASKLDNALPDKRLDLWLKDLMGEPSRWRAIQCDTGGAFVRGLDPALCVMARNTTSEGIETEVQIVVGGYRSGISGSPHLESASITDSAGDVTTVKELHALPELLKTLAKAPHSGILLGFQVNANNLSEYEKDRLESNYFTIFIAHNAHGWQSVQLPELLVSDEKDGSA